MTNASDAAQPAPHPGRWIAMFVLLMAGFMNMVDVSIVNVALPSMQRAVAASDSQIEWVVAAYILVFALGLLPFGRLGDILGRRRMFIAGVAVFTLGSALCGLAPGMGWLIAARVAQGLGGAMMTPQTLAIVPALFPPHERGRAFSLFGLTAGLATVSGPLIGGLLIGADLFGLGWRPIFLVNVPVGLLAILLALKYVPDLPGATGLRNDFVGIGLAALALLLLIAPLIEGRQLGWPAWSFATMAAAVPATALFVRWQRRQAARGGPQLLPVSLIDNRGFVIGMVMIGLLFSGIPGFFLVLALYLQNGYGLDPLQSGLTTLPFSLGVLGASLLSGRFGALWPRRRIAAGALLLAASMISLRFVVLGTDAAVAWSHFAPALLVGGVGLGVAVGPMFQTVLANVGGRDSGSGSGALQSFQQVGGAFGVAIMGELFFARLLAALPGAGDPHAVYATALARAVLYNTAAFAAVALLAQILPKPRAAAEPGGPPVMTD